VSFLGCGLSFGAGGASLALTRMGEFGAEAVASSD